MIRRILETAGIGLVLAGVAFGCFAQTQPTQSNSPQVTSQTTASRLTATETAQARAWALTETEWRRYKILMQGIRGRLSPDLSPVETLGIHARTQQERERYAELWAEVLRQDTERVLAFQRAYDAARRRLHGDEPLIDLAQLPVPPSSTLLQAGDCVLFFTGADCTSCGTTLAILLARAGETDRLRPLPVHRRQAHEHWWMIGARWWTPW